MTPIQWLTLILVALTYLGIAVGSVPRLHMNITTITVVGAALLLTVGAISEEQAFHAIDMGTIVLLFSIMIINVNLRLSGFFGVVAEVVLRFARTPRSLLLLIIVASGILSALFLNDSVCVLFTPLVVEITVRARRNSIPYLIGLAASANIGSTATITGNPQNLLIGQASGIPYLTFLSALAPVAISGLLICWVVIMLLYRREFAAPLGDMVSLPVLTYPRLMWRTLLIVLGMVIAFLAGLPIAASAFVAAAALLISRIKPEKLLEIDWSLLVFFSALFIVTHAIETSGLSIRLFEIIRPIASGGVAPLSIATAGLSNLVSNVPAVLLFRPLVPTLDNPTLAWLTLAMSSTLAGNLTLLGSVANLIVAESAAQRGVRLTFADYLRAGIPITLLTLLVGIAWLMLTNR